jgi:ketosteroid isomerase-like protein
MRGKTDPAGGTRTRAARLAAFSLALSLAITALPAPAAAQAADDQALVKLVSDFVAAERDFDQQRLATLITDDYVEISPIGDVDPRAAFLGFYAADKKQPFPPMTWGEPVIRRWDDTASVINSVSFERPGPAGQPAQRVSMRVGYLAMRSGGKWRLASAQYTPERSKAAAPAKP